MKGCFWPPPMLGAICVLALAVAPGAAAKDWGEIRSQGEISVCANPNALPYASDKEATPGFQIEIARAIAARLGVRLRPAWIVPRMRANLVDCDLMMDVIVVAGVQPPSLKLSMPYQRSGVSLVFARGRVPVQAYADLKPGTRVGVLLNSFVTLVVSRTSATITPFGFEDEMLEAVANGEVDAVAVTAAAAGYFNLRNSDRRVTLTHAEDSEPDLRWNVAVGMRRADDLLVNNINAALAALLADGSIAAIYARYGVDHRNP